MVPQVKSNVAAKPPTIRSAATSMLGGQPTGTLKAKPLRDDLRSALTAPTVATPASHDRDRTSSGLGPRAR